MTISDAANELMLYAENTQAFIDPVVKSLSKHHKRGDYSYDKAIKAFERYCLIPAAKQYALEHGSMTQSWHSMFPKSDRIQAAETLADRWTAEFRLGNYWD